MNIFKNAENIQKTILQPLTAWKEIESKSLKLKDFLFINLTGILLVVFIGRFVGKSLELLSVSSIYYIFLYAFFSMICDFLSFIIAMTAINKLFAPFQEKQDINKACLLIYYSLIPYYFTAFITSLFPSMYFLGVFSLYGLVIYWNGLKSLYKIKENDHLTFFIISVLIIIGIHILLRFIVILPFFKIL